MKLFLLIIAMLSQATAPPRSINGSVNGTVIVAGTSEPIPDAEVALSMTDGTLLETTADSNGRFSLSNVPSGRHTVVIRAEGFFPASAAPGLVPQLGAEIPVTVAQQASPVSIGSVAMVRGAIITGKVLDTQGRPLPFANVQALRQGSAAGLQLVAARLTDDRGEYRLFWVPPGEYFIGVDPRPPAPANLAAAPPPGGLPRLVRTLFPSATDVGQASKVAVKSGDELRGIDISARLDVVTPPPSLVAPAGTAGGVKISGQITNALMPTTGTGVLLVGSEADTTPPRQVGSVALNAATVPFEIPSVPPGKYDLFIRMPDPRGSLGTGGAVQAWGRTTLEVLDRDIADVRLTIHPSVDVPGILKIDGKAAPAGGNLKIGLAPLGPAGRIANYRGIVDRAQTPGDDGKFSIPGAAEGNYDVFVQRGPASSYIADIRQGDTSILASGVVVRDAPPDTFEVLLATDGGILEGVALNSDKSPVGSATVVLVPNDRQLLRLSKTVSAGGDGRYSILGVRPGEYKLFAAAGALPPGGLSPELLSKYDAKGVSVTVKAAATAKADVPVITD